MKTKECIENYQRSSEEAFRVPDIGKGFIPQGITYDAERKCFLITGYMMYGGASPIYVIDVATKQCVKTVRMAHPNGKRFRGHAGGLSLYQGSVYIAGSTKSCMYRYDLKDIYNAPDKSRVSYRDVVMLRSENDYYRVSWTSTDDELLYAGEFYRKGPLFYTAASHKIAVDQNTEFGGLMIGFTLEDNKPVPKVAYSLCNNAQGACFHDRKLYLSVAYGYRPSHIRTYDLKSLPQSGTIRILETEVPLYILGGGAEEIIKEISPMSEEIVIVDRKMYIVSEYASNIYLLGKLRKANRIYATDITWFSE